MAEPFEIRDSGIVRGRIERQAAAGRWANPTRRTPTIASKGQVSQPRIIPPLFGCNLSTTTLRRRKP